jgi:hypothetical protein
VLQHGEVKRTKEPNVKKILALLSSVAAVTLAACGSSSTPSAEKVVVGSAAAGSFTDRALGTGANAVYAQITSTATGAAVTDLAVTIVPMMDMVTMTHSCPVTGPMEYDPADGFYSTGVIFQMAGTWTATVKLTPPGGAQQTASFSTLVVADSGSAKSFTVGTGMTAVKYVLSLNYVNPKVVGLNPVAVTLHSSTDMGMTFSPVNDATFEMVPWMTSMGHGASGSVQPTLLADGVYQGKVMFSMPGDWDVTVKVTLGGASAPAASPLFSTVF